MPRTTKTTILPLPKLEPTLQALTVEQLKWYATALPGQTPTRKGELVAWIAGHLSKGLALRQLWDQVSADQQQVIADVVHYQDGHYHPEVLQARYPQVAAPEGPSDYAYYSFGGTRERKTAKPFDLFFFRNWETGIYIPPDLAALLRTITDAPPPPQIESQAEVLPLAPKPKKQSRWAIYRTSDFGTIVVQPLPGAAGADAPEDAAEEEPLPTLLVSDTERATFHDLAATLYLIQQGKGSVSAATKLPTLPTLRQLRARLLVGDYLADGEYERAEDAIRPLALIVLVQAAKWAAPTGATGNKLELTKAGQAALAAPLGAAQVREAWERWLKSDLLDELTRIRAIKGQQSKDARLTKPAERREKLTTLLRALPVGRWVTFDEALRYMRAERLLPLIERNADPALHVGSYLEYGDTGLGSGAKYWDVVLGSYMRVLVWEYAATLGLVEIAYTAPEEAVHDFGELYGLDDDYLSRYDGLWSVRLTNLGAYALGLTGDYAPPAAAAPTGPPLLRVLPNLDIVVTDAVRLLPNDRAFLERIGSAQSQDVYRLNRDLLLDAAQNGLDLHQVRSFLVARSGVPLVDLPSTVRSFFADLDRRLGALREGGRMLVIESADPFLLTELANDSSLRGLVQRGQIGDRAVLLVPEDQEAAARRQLKKLGYLPRK